jgi:methyl-accepting chemotaxis protein
VAAKVKSLAVQTAKATEEIDVQISRLRGASGDVVDAIRQITARMQDTQVKIVPVGLRRADVLRFRASLDPHLANA